jgi:DNA-binding CsgD family transcriptional regulator
VHLRENQFERATELFYEAAAVPELWPKALQLLGEACGAMGVCLYPIGPGPDSAVCGSSIRGLIDAFLSDGWLKLNPYMQRGMELTIAGRKGLITSEEMLNPDEAARSPFNNEFADRVGLGRARAGMVLGQFGTDLALPIVFERAPAAGPYARAEIARMNQLVSGFKPAVALALKVGFETSKRIVNSLAGSGRDFILFGQSGRVLHMVSGLERHIGDAFDLRGGVLHSWERRTDLALLDAIRRAVALASMNERAVGTLGLPRRSGRKPLSVQIVPITGAAHDIFMLARAVMIVTDPEAKPRDQTATLAATFGLSPAEARLASRIGRGEELKAIAEAEGIVIETARARLKAVFAKTGTHRQAELAVLVASLSR